MCFLKCNAEALRSYTVKLKLRPLLLPPVSVWRQRPSWIVFKLYLCVCVGEIPVPVGIRLCYQSWPVYDPRELLSSNRGWHSFNQLLRRSWRWRWDGWTRWIGATDPRLYWADSVASICLILCHVPIMHLLFEMFLFLEVRLNTGGAAAELYISATLVKTIVGFLSVNEKVSTMDQAEFSRCYVSPLKVWNNRNVRDSAKCSTFINQTWWRTKMCRDNDTDQWESRQTSSAVKLQI